MYFESIFLNPYFSFIKGLVRSRDGGRLSPNTQPYMSLPSPNIQSAQSENIPKQAVQEEPEETNTKGPDSTQLGKNPKCY